MKTPLAILRHYRRMGVRPAFPAFGKWFALSQYGYALKACKTRKEALRYALNYYTENFQLIAQ